MIKVKNLVKSYNGNKVLKGIDLNVKKGEIYGFIGHNGAGKSTTMNILTGLIDFQGGACFINGKNIKSNKKIAFKDIGYLPEEPRFYQYMTALEYLSFVGTMGGEGTKEIKKKSEDLLELVKLTKSGQRPIGSYSRGMKQRLGIAVAMYHNPDILLLDEPSSALDPQGRRDVVDILSNLKKQGKTIFLSTHILDDVEKVCDRIGILHGGKIVLEESLDVLKKDFIQPIYDIEFEDIPGSHLVKNLKSKDYIDEVIGEGRNFSIYLENIQNDSGLLLKELAAINKNVVSLNLRKNNLEEIYMKVVKEGE